MEFTSYLKNEGDNLRKIVNNKTPFEKFLLPDEREELAKETDVYGVHTPYKEFVSNCCSAPVENGICMDCYEPCEEVPCDN